MVVLYKWILNASLTCLLIYKEVLFSSLFCCMILYIPFLIAIFSANWKQQWKFEKLNPQCAKIGSKKLKMVLSHSNQFWHTVDGAFPIFIPDSKRVIIKEPRLASPGVKSSLVTRQARVWFPVRALRMHKNLKSRWHDPMGIGQAPSFGVGRKLNSKSPQI